MATFICFLLSLILVGEKPAPEKESAAPAGVAPDVLAKTIKDLLQKNLPETLVDKSHNWGHTAEVPTGVKIGSKGVLIRPKIAKGMRNDGKWRKVKVMTANMPQGLFVDVKNLERVDGETTRFDLTMAFDAWADVKQQKWELGVKWYDIECRARFRIHLKMACETSSHWDTAKFPPELVFRMKATKSELKYDHVKVEHIAGVGGEPAQWIGEAVLETLKLVKPNLEKELSAKANKAIEKAGNSREFRVGLTGVKKTKINESKSKN